MLRHRQLLPLVVFLTLILASTAEATIQNLKSAKEAYEGAKLNCQTCHLDKVGRKGELNAYGLALQASMGGEGLAKALTVEDYRAVEGDDADEDGAGNLQELESGTNPGDPESAPDSASQEIGQDAPEHHSKLPVGWVSELLGRVIPEVSAQESADAVEEAEYVGAEACAACHEERAHQFEQSTHARISFETEEAEMQGCEMCHGPGSLHVNAGGGRGVGGIINPRKDPSTCFECHTDKKMSFRLPHHHPVLEGKVSCMDCHDAHGEDVRPWSATTLKDTNEACFKCHQQQRGPFVWGHEALEEGCTTCHQVHGSINEKMLVARDWNLCLRCHTQANFARVGQSNHSGRLDEGTCWSGGCHTAVHGSNFDDHLRY